MSRDTHVTRRVTSMAARHPARAPCFNVYTPLTPKTSPAPAPLPPPRPRPAPAPAPAPSPAPVPVARAVANRPALHWPCLGICRDGLDRAGHVFHRPGHGQYHVTGVPGRKPRDRRVESFLLDGERTTKPVRKAISTCSEISNHRAIVCALVCQRSTTLPTNYRHSAWNSVTAQPISTVRPPNHAPTAAEMPNRRNCLHCFRTACTAGKRST